MQQYRRHVALLQQTAGGSAAVPDITPAERAASHGTACSSQPERRAFPVLRPPHLSRFSYHASMPAQAGGCVHAAAEPDLAQPKQHQQPRTAPSSPALTDRTLDFTTPVVRSADAGATQHQQALFLEERLICSERLPRAAVLSLDQPSPFATDPGAWRQRRGGGASFGAMPELDSQQELEVALAHYTNSPLRSQELEADQECSSSIAAGGSAAESDGEAIVPNTVTPRQHGSCDAAAAFMKGLPASPTLANGEAGPCGRLLDADLGCAEALDPPCSSREGFLAGLPRSPRLENFNAPPRQLHVDGDASRAALQSLLDSSSPEASLWALEQQRQQGTQHSAGWSGFYEGADIVADADIEEEASEDAAAEHGAVSPSPVRVHPLALAGGRDADAAALRKWLGPNGLQRLPRKRARAGPGSPSSGSTAAAMQLPASPTLEDALERVHAAARRSQEPLHATAQDHGDTGRQDGKAVPGSAERHHRGAIMQQLSAEEQQEEAALERLLTPQRCTRQQGRGVLEELSAENAKETAALERLLTPQRSRRQQQQQVSAAPGQQGPAEPAANALPLRSCTVEGAAPAASNALHAGAELVLHSPRFDVILLCMRALHLSRV